MNYIYKLLLIVILCISLTSFKNDGIKYIIIKKVGIDIETSFSVNCNDFELLFNGDYETDTIYNIDKIKELNSLIDSLQFLKNEVSFVDTRAKIFLIHEYKIDTICISQFEVIKNTKTFKISPQLINYIYSVDK